MITRELQNTLNEAYSEAMKRRHEFLTLEHLLYAMLREKNVIIARQMLPIFEGEPAGWDAACYLNLGAHQQGKPLAQHLSEWQTNSPPALRPFLARLAALFLNPA